MHIRTLIQAGSALALACSIAACSSAATPAPTAAQSAVAGTPAATLGTPASATAPTSPANSAAAKAKVNANTASQAEIAAALQANGVINPASWAKEVVEYRPYPTDDPTFKRLQDNLAKYKPDAATLAGILATLQP